MTNNYVLFGRGVFGRNSQWRDYVTTKRALPRRYFLRDPRENSQFINSLHLAVVREQGNKNKKQGPTRKDIIRDFQNVILIRYFIFPNIRKKYLPSMEALQVVLNTCFNLDLSSIYIYTNINSIC